MRKERYEKNWRYRQRNAVEGKCPHCGKPAAPYAECPERRFYKRMYALLRRMEKWGAMVRRPDGTWVLGPTPGASGPRGYYKTERGGELPRGFLRFMENLLREVGRPLTEQEITAEFNANLLEGRPWPETPPRRRP